MQNFGSRGEHEANGPPSLISPMRFTSTTDRKSDTVSSAELWEPRRTSGEWTAIFDQFYAVHFYHGLQKRHGKWYAKVTRLEKVAKGSHINNQKKSKQR
jgi:hypothetical protein